jgi:hypothetical protein
VEDQDQVVSYLCRIWLNQISVFPSDGLFARSIFNALPASRRSNFGASMFHCRALSGYEENQAINSSRESVMCIARSCITNGALDLIVDL